LTPEKIISVVNMYERRLRAAGVLKKRIDPKRTFASLSKDEILAHAYFLTDDLKEFVSNPEKKRKTGSHLTVIQMCLSFAGWYTLEDLMNHNRPDAVS